MTSTKVLERLIDFAPKIIAAFTTTRCRCIAATALGIDVLQHFDIAADPFPVLVEVVNAKFVAAERRGADPVTAIARGGHLMLTSPESSADGWGGHLMIHVPRRQVLIDLDFQQFSRPHEHLSTDPAEVLVWPTGTTSRQFRNPTNGARMTVAATDDDTFRLAPDWYASERRRPAVDAVIRAITKNRWR